MKKYYIYLSLSLLLISFIFSIFIQLNAFDKRAIGRDQTLHFYDMKKWYESNKLPTTSARFIGTAVVKEEFTTPRVPGGIYYIFYLLFYKLGGDNLVNARIINLVFSFSMVLIFILWLYYKFGLCITSILSSIILCNPYIIMAVTDFWNPNYTLLFSFLFLILLFEYIQSSNETINKISAIFMFPILAIMAQSHFTVFFTMIPTLILYLLIRFKTTKKYLLFWFFGVFLSFLLYLPYLISEFQTGFSNLKLATSVRDSFNKLPIPQLYSILIFPTNEFSSLIGTRFNSIKYLWLSGTPYIYGIFFLLFTLVFSFFVFIKSIIYFYKNKYKDLSGIDKSFREIIFIILLYIPTSIFCFIIFRSKSGTFHYLYSIFALSFIPMILYLYNIRNIIKNNISLYSFIILVALLNLVSLNFQMKRYFELFEKPRNYDSIKQVAEFIKEDSKGKTIKIYNNFAGNMPYQYEDIFLTYFPDYNIKSSDDPEILYSIRDNIVLKNWDEARNNREMEFLISNNAIELTNINGYTIFKFPKVVKY